MTRDHLDLTDKLRSSRVLQTLALPVGVIFTGILATMFVSYQERRGSLHTIWLTGDVEFGVVIALLGTVVLGALSWFLADAPKGSILRTHLTYSWLLYLGLIASGVLLFPRWSTHRGSLGYGTLLAFTAVGIIACLLNLGVVAVRGRTSGRSEADSNYDTTDA
jgi:hypothetical protein